MLALFLTNPIMNDVKARGSGLDAAFADFINLVYANSKSPEKQDHMCIFGYDSVSSILESQAKKKIVLEEGKKNFSKCRVIYVAKNKSRYVRTFIDDMNASGALTIALFDSFVNDGGMLFIDIGRRNFELTVNSQTLKSSEVKIDSSITGLIIDKR